MRRYIWPIAMALALTVTAMGVHHLLKPLPKGLSLSGEAHPARVRFLKDLTYMDASGRRQVRQEIFDEALRIINSAERLLVLDFFLLNGYQGQKRPERTRVLSDELAEALIRRRKASPGLRIVLITDPINTLYGGARPPHLDALRASGVEVVVTDLRPLRDSNPVYSAFYRAFVGWWGNREGGTLMKNPLGDGTVTLRSWLGMLNFKANHRKVMVADSPSGWVGLVTSANPHDASSAHGNIAVRVEGPAVADLLMSEAAVSAFSGGPEIAPIIVNSIESSITASVLTEGKIKIGIINALRRAKGGDMVDVAVFYLSDLEVMDELKTAWTRGARVRALLDPNHDAFGHDKNGIPNRAAGAELKDHGIEVRWCDTHGEQCHAKMLLARYADGTARLVGGSANFTRRNLDDFNLETDMLIEGPAAGRFFIDARRYFDRVWDNAPGERYSVAFEEYEDRSVVKAFLGRVMESSGMGTF